MVYSVTFRSIRTNKEIIVTKLPESGDLCGNITEFGVVEGSPEPAG